MGFQKSVVGQEKSEKCADGGIRLLNITLLIIRAPLGVRVAQFSQQLDHVRGLLMNQKKAQIFVIFSAQILPQSVARLSIYWRFKID